MSYNIRLFILLIALVGTGTSLLIQLDEETITSTKKYVLAESVDVPAKESIDGKSYRIVNEYKKKGDEDSSAPRNSLSGVVRSGVRKLFPLKKIVKGRQGYLITDDSTEDVSDRIDNVETKVEVISDELHSFETIAGIYFIARLFSGLIFNTII